VRAVAYTRVSTQGQEAGLSLDDQLRKVEAAILARGWTVSATRRDVGSGKKVNPNLERTLGDLDAGLFDVLVVARLDRLSRSVGDFAMLMDRAGRRGWSILCLDPEVDLTTPFGRAMAGVAAVFAQLERELISQRQRESVAARRAAGTYRVAGGAAQRIPVKTQKRIADLAIIGYGCCRILKQLTLEGHPPVSEMTVLRYAKKAKEKAA